MVDVDRPLPSDFHRLEAALAGREAGVQTAILRIVADAIALRDFEIDRAVPKLRAAELRSTRKR
jgi:hypothetical protein